MELSTKVGITGSSGFIGKYLITELSEQGYNLIEIDILKGFDITLVGTLEKLDKLDYIIHLAARSFVPDSFDNPNKFYYDNYLSTLNILEYARKNKTKVIYFSSYLYGTPLYLPIDELHPLSPHNPYSQTKLICEKLCEGYQRDFGLDIVVFRPFNIYGKGQNPSFLIPSIINQLETGEITLNDPRPKRDFVHVLDVASAVSKAIAIDFEGYLVFNLGYGKSFSIKHLTDIISEISHKKITISYRNIYRKGEVLDTIANINKVRTILSWEPKIDLLNGLKQIIY